MTAIPPYNERELLSQVASGDQQALGKIVDRYTRIIYAHLLSYIKDAQKAEEVTQDIFLSIWKNRAKLTEIDNFPGYVYSMTRKRAISALKEKVLNTVEPQEDKLQHIFIHPGSSLEFKELAEVLNTAINALPARRKEVFLLSRREHMTYEEIASQLNISRSAVRQHVVAALLFLRDYLKERTGIIVSGIIWFGLIV